VGSTWNDSDHRETKIEVKDLTKCFGDLKVLDKISFNVAKGEFLSIVGPTGCGKTTFLNCLSKLIPTTEGNIYIDGQEADPKKHNISFVFQEPTCMPWRTVRENVAFGMEVKQFPKEKLEERLKYILDLVGLTDTADLYPNQVSSSIRAENGGGPRLCRGSGPPAHGRALRAIGCQASILPGG